MAADSFETIGAGVPAGTAAPVQAMALTDRTAKQATNKQRIHRIIVGLLSKVGRKPTWGGLEAEDGIGQIAGGRVDMAPE